MKQFLLAMLITWAASMHAQTAVPGPDHIYDYTDTLDVAPTFPGGMNKFYTYLAKDLRTPLDETAGKLFTTFVINRDGSVSDITIEPKKYPRTNGAIMHTLTRSPKWNPGRKDLQSVRVRMHLPITIGAAVEHKR